MAGNDTSIILMFVSIGFSALITFLLAFVLYVVNDLRRRVMRLEGRAMPSEVFERRGAA